MRRRILFISMCLPFNQAFHAGGKTFNYYINAFANDPHNEVTLISKVLPEEEEYVKTVNPAIKGYYVRTPKKLIHKLWGYLKSLNSKFNPKYPYGNVLTKEIFDQIERVLQMLQKQGYIPDVIVLEWTWILLFIDIVKKYYPNAKYVASEHDVSFLGLKRICDNTEGYFKKRKAQIYYSYEKRYELQAIKKCDYVVTHNKKDYQLLVDNGINDKILGTIVPYFVQQKPLDRCSNNRDILFYGAMNRLENYNAAIWFIDHVMNQLCDMDIRLIIIGNKPPKQLLQKQNEKIICTGYVESILPYFASCMCLVAPLQEGAGIKVKILEAMALGAPVLTNDIGIEGIYAEDKKEFLYCRTENDYINYIKAIYHKQIDVEPIAINARKFIQTNYDLKASYKQYSEKIYELSGK